ncbi:MAG: hypothetical protein V1678_04525 [Candidatus Aenigmatarchaeota archaeon]
MPLGICPNDKCGKMIDIDGYVEHGIPTLFYCECGKIYDMRKFGELNEVPKEDVNLSGLEGKYPVPLGSVAQPVSRGLFIRKSRWSKSDYVQSNPLEQKTDNTVKDADDWNDFLEKIKEKMMALKVGLGADNTRKGIPEDELGNYK